MPYVIAIKLRRFTALPPAQKRVFLCAALLLPLARLAISRVGLASSISWIEARKPASRLKPPISEMRAMSRLINLAANHTPSGGSCLARSVLLKWLLLRRGVECQLHIGVRMAGKRLEAHAWIEYEGEPINDRRENCESFCAFPKPIGVSPAVHDFT
jgi:hypothetical protein